jgi:hypothetical protein
MKSFTYIFVLTFSILAFSNCEILRGIAQEELENRLSCIPPTQNVYSASYQIVAAKTFESDIQASAERETVKLKCMTSEQIKGFAELLDFESKRLEYAKFAYAYCSDQKNYYLTMSPLFTFESYKRELEDLTR